MWNLQFTSEAYNEAVLPRYDFPSDEFDRAVAAAGRAAFHETLGAGYPVFYSDTDGLEVMELPDGEDSKSAGYQGPLGEQLRDYP
jgi:hypothetical protein